MKLIILKNKSNTMKPWTKIPVITWNSGIIPQDVEKAIDECFSENRKNAYQMLYIIPEKEKDDYDECYWIVSKYLIDNGFTGDKILVDNTW